MATYRAIGSGHWSKQDSWQRIPQRILGRSRWDRLRFWLIQKLAGKTPVILNFRVTIPSSGLDGKVGLFAGNGFASIGDIAVSDERWSRARGVVEAIEGN